MKIGFTGTQIGMDQFQRTQLYHHLIDLGATEFHHGDCIGADKEAHDVALAAGVEIIVHPPENDKKRAFCEGYKRRANPLPYLERNRRIVESCDVLIAAPKSNQEELRSGTWSTYRYAKRIGKAVILLGRNADE